MRVDSDNGQHSHDHFAFSEFQYTLIPITDRSLLLTQISYVRNFLQQYGQYVTQKISIFITKKKRYFFVHQEERQIP